MEEKQYLEDMLLEINEEKLKNELAKEIHFLTFDQLQIIKAVIQIEDKRKVRKLRLFLERY